MKLQSFIGIALLVVIVGITGCQKSKELPPDTFTATYVLEDGRNFSISGRSNGMPGERSDYTLKLNNNDERWQDEYYVLLVNSDSIVQEIRHGKFDLPGEGGLQEPVKVVFPKDFTGALGLCVFIPQHGRLIATLSVGVDNAITTGWPDVSQLVQPAKAGS